MKSLLTAFVLFASSNAFAALPAKLDCDSGNLGEDSYVYVNVTAATVDIGMHESNYPLARAKTVTRGNTIAVVDRTIRGSAEGDTFVVQVSALLVYDEARKVLNATFFADGYPIISNKELNCK